MREKTEFKGQQDGFTIIELMVTIMILAVFYGLVVANFNSWRGPQYVRLGAAEIATNIYKTKSYALSARNIQGDPARFYVMELTTVDGSNGDYKLSGIASDQNGGNLFYDSLESFPIPGTAYVKKITFSPPNIVAQDTNCLQIAFVLPFGKTYIDSQCRLLNPDPVVNPIYSLKDLDSLANVQASVTLGWVGGTQVKTINIDGISGRVEVP